MSYEQKLNARCPQCKKFKSVDKPCKKCGIIPAAQERSFKWVYAVIAGWLVALAVAALTRRYA